MLFFYSFVFLYILFYPVYPVLPFNDKECERPRFAQVVKWFFVIYLC